MLYKMCSTVTVALALTRQCKVCGLCYNMAYLFATRGLIIACNDRWWTYLLTVPSLRLSCHRQTMEPLLEELNRQQYKEEMVSYDPADKHQISSRWADGNCGLQMQHVTILCFALMHSPCVHTQPKTNMCDWQSFCQTGDTLDT